MKYMRHFIFILFAATLIFGADKEYFERSKRISIIFGGYSGASLGLFLSGDRIQGRISVGYHPGHLDDSLDYHNFMAVAGLNILLRERGRFRWYIMSNLCETYMEPSSQTGSSLNLVSVHAGAGLRYALTEKIFAHAEIGPGLSAYTTQQTRSGKRILADIAAGEIGIGIQF